MKKASLRPYITFFPAAGALVLVIAVKISQGIPIFDMTSDMATIARIHPLSGIISNLGAFLWCATAAICLFSVVVLRGIRHSDETTRFLLSSGFLTAYLLFDDFFEFHENLAKQYLGLHERYIYLALGAAVLFYSIRFRRVIARTGYVYLLSAVALLGSSVVIDAVLARWMRGMGDWMYLFEDGTKWLGIAAWCSYYVNASFQFVAAGLAAYRDTASNMNASPRLGVSLK